MMILRHFVYAGTQEFADAGFIPSSPTESESRSDERPLFILPASICPILLSPIFLLTFTFDYNYPSDNQLSIVVL